MEKSTSKCNVGLLLILVIVNAVALIGINLYTSSLHKAQTDATLVKEKLNSLSANLSEARWLAANWVLICHQSNSPEKTRFSQFVKTDLLAEYSTIAEHTANWDKDFVKSMEVVKEKIIAFNEIGNEIMTGLAHFEDYDNMRTFIQMESYVADSKAGVGQIQSDLVGECNSLSSICNDKIQSATSTISTLNIVALLITVIISSLLAFFLLKAKKE